MFDIMDIVTRALSAISPQPDGDFSDRLNYCVTTVALIAASMFVAGWSFVGSPIQCWFPAYYRGWWMEYALDYCYVQNTYYVPMFEKRDMPQTWDIGQHMMPLPVNDTVKEQRQIGYYQWVPFILIFQALFFYLPVVLWRFMYDQGGLKINSILNNCSLSANMEEGSRQSNMRKVAFFLVQEHSAHEHFDRRSLKRITTGNYVVFAYLMLKLLFALNAAFQFVLLKSILGVNSYDWGWQVTKDLYNGIDWEETGNFPRITLCDFSVRELSNTHSHTVQCVLMINMFNEKIFLVLWYWLSVICAVSVYSLISWCIYVFFPNQGADLVNRYIHKIDPDVASSSRKKETLKDFVQKYLRPDGTFLVKLISSNNGDMVACSLLKTLWDEYQKNGRTAPPSYFEPLLVKNSKIAEDEL